MTNQTGIAAVKITSLVRPGLLLKLSSFFNLVKQDKTILNSNLFSWKQMVNMSDAEFENLYNNLQGLKGNYEKFNKNEIGELRNMIKRLDEIVEVRNIF